MHTKSKEQFVINWSSDDLLNDPNKVFKFEAFGWSWHLQFKINDEFIDIFLNVSSIKSNKSNTIY